MNKDLMRASVPSQLHSVILAVNARHGKKGFSNWVVGWWKMESLMLAGKSKSEEEMGLLQGIVLN